MSVKGNQFSYETAAGPVTICEEGGEITHIRFGKYISDMDCETAAIKDCKKQLDEYFSGKRKIFDLRLKPEGTVFQKKVWCVLLDIPYGHTASYKEIAQKCGCPKGFRAVGMANNKNPIPVIIPCHRVVGINGKLVGYAGGLDIKQLLLDLEKRYSER